MYMKRRYMLLILLVVFGLFFWVIVRDSTKNIGVPPKNPPVDSIAPEKKPAEKPDLLVVSSPLPETLISDSPLVIRGKARGKWFFEATAPVSVVNWDGLIIGEGYIKVNEGYDWMTTDFVPFTGTISYDATALGPYNYGFVILKKNNASDDPQFDDSLEFKILFP